MTSGKQYNILVLPGDGIGPEVVREAVKVLQTFSTPTRTFDLQHELVGGASIDAYGDSLTDEVKEAALASDAVLFGSVGGPKWDNKRRGLAGPEGGLLRLRQALNIYGNIRPCLIPSQKVAQKYSPLKPEILEGVDFVVLRENVGGAYFGRKVEEDNYAMDEWAYSRDEVERITRLAAYISRRKSKPYPIISCDKANVLASSRLWRCVVEDTVSKEFPDVQLSHQLADSAALIMVTNPRSLNGVLLCDDTFGDILSDVAGAVPGTLGVLPSASLSGIPGEGRKVHGLYEPTHGTAPTIAGKNIANPIAQILCVAMMFRYSFQMDDEAQMVEDAVSQTMDEGIITGDLGGESSTSDVGDAIVAKIQGWLKSKSNGVAQ